MFNNLKTKVNKDSNSRKDSFDQGSVKNEGSLKRSPSIESINSNATSDARSRKKDEVIKKWESKVQTLVSNVREKNTVISELEKCLTKEKNDYEKKITEIKESSALNIQSLLDEHRLQIHKIEQQKDKYKKLAMDAESRAESLRTQCFSVGEEQESIKDYTQQELAKIKHMLRQKELENDELMKQVEDMNVKLERIESTKISMNADIQKKQSDLIKINKEREIETEERRSQQTTIRGLLTDKENLERNFEELSAKFSKTQSLLNNVERSSAELHSKYQQSSYDNDQLKTKLSRLESDKQDRESDLKDRIRSLENHLAMVRETEKVDEQVKLLEEKCFKLEARNREEKELKDKLLQSWSDRVESLETQIANLNCKIAEDAEELGSNNNTKMELTKQYEKMIKELKEDLIQRDMKVDNLQLKLDEQNSEFCQSKANWEKIEAQLYYDCQNKNSECLNLSQENFELKKDHVKMQDQLNSSLSELKSKTSSFIKLDEEMKKVKNELDEKLEEINSLNSERFKRELKVTDLTSQVSSLDAAKSELEKSTSQIDSDFKSLQKQFKQTNEEKDGLKKKLEILTDQFYSLKSDCDHRIKTMQAEVDSRMRELEVSHADIHELKDQIREMEMEKETVIIGLESTEVLKLKSQIEALNTQLSDKNNVLRTQKQKIGDLKKTLNKEIRTNNGSLCRVHSNIEFSGSKNSSSHQLIGSDSNLNDTNNIHSYHNNQHQQQTQHLQLSNNIASNDGAASSSGDDAPVVVDKNGYVIMDQINFKYLKHVIMKFLLSKESEAIQLIKAVSTLLRLSTEEESQLKTTLVNRKGSWFSSTPSKSKSISASNKTSLQNRSHKPTRIGRLS